jgi:hypothetical protein
MALLPGWAWVGERRDQLGWRVPVAKDRPLNDALQHYFIYILYSVSTIS